MKTLLDIITITKDDFDGIGATIRSTKLLREEYEVRHIIVDSSNNENSQKIKEELANEKNLDYVWQKPSGIAPAFNAGLRESKANWVWFLNGGDVVHPDINSSQLLYLIENSGADAIIFDTEGMQTHRTLRHPPLWALWPLLKTWIPHPSTILRRILFDKYGHFDERYSVGMDFEIWFRFFSKAVAVDLVSIPIVLFDETGISSSPDFERNIPGKEASKILRSYFWVLIRKWIRTGISIPFYILYYSNVYLLFKYPRLKKYLLKFIKS